MLSQKKKKMERKTRVVINEDGDLEYVPVKGFKLTDEDRISIVRDFVEQRMSSEEIVERYELSSKQVLYGWVFRYMEEQNVLSLFSIKSASMDERREENEPRSLSSDEQLLRIEQLEQSLRLERLRSEAFSTMIDIAEQEFNIPIRKKSGTKQ